MPTECPANDQVERGTGGKFDVRRQLPKANTRSIVQEFLLQPDFIETGRRQRLDIAFERQIAKNLNAGTDRRHGIP